jgi:hypothetical protein
LPDLFWRRISNPHNPESIRVISSAARIITIVLIVAVAGANLLALLWMIVVLRCCSVAAKLSVEMFLLFRDGFRTERKILTESLMKSRDQEEIPIRRTSASAYGLF